jgi:predicted Zn-dependent protease
MLRRRSNAKFRWIADDAVNAYVTNLGTALATASDDRNREWQFHVVDAEVLNAFALPAGSST